MKVTFKYQNNEYLNIDEISVVGSFNEYNPNASKMELKDGVWQTEIDLPIGENYYKFLINNNLRINDSEANIYLPHINDELYSVVIIDEDDNRRFNNTQYTVNIEKYNITADVYNKFIPFNKKDFNISVDEKVVVRFRFTDVTGLHPVTCLWVSPMGDIYDFSENILFTPKGEETEPLDIWFWLDITSIDKLLSGRWEMKLFIDGDFVLADEFTIGEVNSYALNGGINYK